MEKIVKPSNAEIDQHIKSLDSNVVLRNLAFWLDLAIAKGRQIDFERINELSQTSSDNEQTLSENEQETVV